mmetsp:Transcript_5028/g.10634  ORF Transcript_5028/g.10634 Transcript_5028/m.10634 type:complete len:1031 (+) Transcript_5028:134-3226(+)
MSSRKSSPTSAGGGGISAATVENASSATTRKESKDGNNNNKKKAKAAAEQCYWPTQSSSSLPALPGKVAAGLVGGRGMEFSVNEECTSLTLAPSGRHVVAGFTDGTIRLFDLTGRLWSPSSSISSSRHDDDDMFDQDSDDDDEDLGAACGGGKKGVDDEMRDLFDDASESSDDDDADGTNNINGTLAAGRGRARSVCSKSNEQFGAVAAQIHAKGVITSLLMDVAIAQDGLYAFGGVLRGSMELIAVDLSKVEAYHDALSAASGGRETRVGTGGGAGGSEELGYGGNGCGVDILDLVSVYRHSDAKLKGFGACTRLRKDGEVEYRLFTGKGIKNIHIWSFIPESSTRSEPQWQCLYDTPTNGNTIKYLHFRYDPNGLLQGISKSDDQKLRVWDLSCEQGTNQDNKGSIIKQLRKANAKMVQKQQSQGDGGVQHVRPKKPPFVDVTSTESTLGVYGPYAFAGGPDMYNQMSVVNLDVDDVLTPYNHTELALPGVSEDPFEAFGAAGRRSRSGRQQRGELKSVVSVAGLESDAGHVLLELSDGSVAHYTQDGTAQARLEPLPSHFYKSSLEQRVSIMDGDSGNDGTASRRICISRIGAEGIAVLVSSTFNPNTARGTLMLSRLADSTGKSPTGFWGFHVPQALSIERLMALKPKADLNTTATELATPSKKKWRGGSSRSPSAGTASQTPAAQAIVTPSSKTLKAKKGKKGASSVSPDGLPWQESNILTGTTSFGTAISPDVKVVAAKNLKVVTKHDKRDKSSQKNIKKRSVSPKIPRSSAHASPKKTASSSKKDECATTGTSRSRERLQSPRASRERLQSPRKPTPKAKKAERTRLPAGAALRWINSAKAVSDFVSTHHRHKRPRLRVQDLPKDTVHQRVVVSRQSSIVSVDSVSSDATNPCDTTSLHEFERRRLAAEHRAGHEMLRKNLISRTERQIAAWNAENIRSGGAKPTFDKCKKWTDSTVAGYEDMLHDMLDRQQMEASTMVAMQTAENRGKEAALLRVSFPFPELFDRVRSMVMDHFPAVPRELR